MKDVVTTARRRPSVLVTGFGAFPGTPDNPTLRILADLTRHSVTSVTLGLEQLPVIYGEVEAALQEAVARHRPDAILHLGVATRRRAISLETRAVNRSSPIHPDAAGRLPPARISADGPASLRATFPDAAILAALTEAGLDADLSRDAGDYVCNATLYRSLRMAAAPQIGFLHVPKPRPDGSVRGGAAAPALADLTRAVRLAIVVMGQHAVREQALTA